MPEAPVKKRSDRQDESGMSSLVDQSLKAIAYKAALSGIRDEKMVLDRDGQKQLRELIDKHARVMIPLQLFANGQLEG